MKALVKSQKGKGFVSLEDRAVPSAGPGEVRIRVHYAGVCGTDLHVWNDEGVYWAPCVLGHEFSGEIAEVGEGVDRWKAGDRVVAEPHTKACGVCALCRSGDRGICPEKRSIGWGSDGAMADYVVMPAHLLHRIPDGVSFRSAALTEPLAIVVHQALERCGIEFQDTVLITGCGPIGLLAAYVARKAGAGPIYMTGMNAGKKARFGAAEALGVDRIVNVEEEDAVEVVRELTNGRGVDVVIETSGAAPAIAQAMEAVRIRGRISAIGISSSDTVAIPWNRAIFKACDVYFNMSSKSSAWDRALRLLAAGTDDLDPVVTDVTTLDRWQEVFEKLQREEGIKALFDLTA